MSAVLLATLRPRRVSDGAVQTLRWAAGGAAHPYYYRSEHWEAGLAQLPAIVATLGFGDGGRWAAGAVASAVTLRFRPPTAARLAALAALWWPNAAVTVELGGDGTAGADAVVILEARATAARVEDGALIVSLADPAADLSRPALDGRFAGTGGVEGPAEVKGRIKRRSFGRCWNVEGRLLDAATSIYELSDPARPLQAIDAVRDRGNPAPALATVAWAGSVAATFAALQGAAAPAGGAAIAPSIGCVKWWTTPTLLTADVRGEIGPGYTETAAGIASALIASRAGPAFTAGTVTAAEALRPAPAGLHLADEGETLAGALDRLLGGVSLFWLLDPAGTIRIGEWTFGAPTATIPIASAARTRAYAPVRRVRLGWTRNERVMNRGEIAGALLVADVEGLPQVQQAVVAQAAAADAAALAQINTILAQDAAEVRAQQREAAVLNESLRVLGNELASLNAGLVATRSDLGVLRAEATFAVDVGGNIAGVRFIAEDGSEGLTEVLILGKRLLVDGVQTFRNPVTWRHLGGGDGFGPDALVEWIGPAGIEPAAATKANAILWRDLAGAAKAPGQNVLSASSQSDSPTAEVVIGPFAPTGASRRLSASFSLSRVGSRVSAFAASGVTSATLQLYRKIGVAAEAPLGAAVNVTGGVTPVSGAGVAGDPAIWTDAMAAAFDQLDSDPSASNRTFRLAITARSTQAVSGTVFGVDTLIQALGLSVTEG